MWRAGYNTLETTKEPILEHIRKQSAIYLTDEHEIQRSNPGGKLDDSRVDVALFFIAPHRLRPLDIEFITDLAELVPVVGGCFTFTCPYILEQKRPSLDQPSRHEVHGPWLSQ